MNLDQLLDTAFQLLDQLNVVYRDAKSYEDISSLSLRLLEVVKKLDEYPLTTQVDILKKYAAKLDDYRKNYQDAKFKEELFFAEDILNEKKEITSFAYERYEKLVAGNLELTYKHLDLDKNTPKRLLFAGIGPVPLSAILFARNDLSLTIDVLDKSPEALDLCSKIVKKYGCQDRINVLDAIPFEKCTTLNGYDIIWAASMLGSTSEEKYNVYAELASRLEPGKIVFSRTSRKDSMFELLHVLFPLDRLKEFYEVLEYKANEKPAVNASIVLKRN